VIIVRAEIITATLAAFLALTTSSHATAHRKRLAGNGNRSRQGRCMAHCVEAVNLVLGVC
jgi:hypothetical protein